MYCVAPVRGEVVTEIEALKILTGVEGKHIASGGVGESAGAVVLIIEGAVKNVKKAIALIESIKGEPPLKGFKGTCEKCVMSPANSQGKRCTSFQSGSGTDPSLKISLTSVLSKANRPAFESFRIAVIQCRGNNGGREE